MSDVRERSAARAAGRNDEDRARMVVHDLRNSVGSIILNLEIVADPAQVSGIALEAAVDALDEARRLKEMLANLRSALEARS